MGDENSHMEHGPGDLVFDALESKDLVTLRQLLDDGVDIHQRGFMGVRFIDFAAVQGNADCLRELLIRGADVNDVSRGEPVMHKVWIVECLRVLITHKADINKKDMHGFTAVHVASMKGDDGILQELVRSGADLGLATGPSGSLDFAGSSLPLHVASKYGHLNCVRSLFETRYEAPFMHTTRILCEVSNLPTEIAEEIAEMIRPQPDIFARDSFGKRAIDLAKGRGHEDIVLYLQNQEKLFR